MSVDRKSKHNCVGCERYIVQPYPGPEWRYAYCKRYGLIKANVVGMCYVRISNKSAAFITPEDDCPFGGIPRVRKG